MANYLRLAESQRGEPIQEEVAIKFMSSKGVFTEVNKNMWVGFNGQRNNF